MGTVDIDVLFNFSDGELATPTDMVGLQKALTRYQFGDWLEEWAQGMDESGNLINPVTEFLRAFATGGSMNVTLQPGVFVCRPSTHVDPDPRGFVGRILNTISQTINAADPTNPRWDIISAKVVWDNDTGSSTSVAFKDQSTGAITAQSKDKRRRAQLTYTYTAGTPAATPAVPAPPSGEEIVLAVLVPALASVITTADLYDRRMHAGSTVYPVPLTTMFANAGSPSIGTSGHIAAAAGSDIAIIPLAPPGGNGKSRHNLRLARLRLAHLTTAGTGRIRLVQVSAAGSPGPTINVLADISSSFTIDGTFRSNQVLDASTLAYWAQGNAWVDSVGNGNGSEYLALEWRAGASGDRVAGVCCEWYGGL